MSSRIAMLSTYPPTQCGIATFARSMAFAMADLGQSVDIVRLTDHHSADGGAMVARQHTGPDDLPRTIHALNSYDAVILQHEFGIYNGPDGQEVLDVMNHVSKPIVSILHTVIEVPTNGQRRVMQGLLSGSDAVVVLSHSAARVLTRNYTVNQSRLHVIPHGSPDFNAIARPTGFRMRPRLLTWGLLSPGKGIEWGIRALSLLTDLDPTPDYLVVGQTHPKVVARDGVAYRASMEKLAQDLGVRDRVTFVDGYLDTQALNRIIGSADFYLLPYDTRDQVTSGVLVEAIVAGGPVIATRFPHAVELLGDGSGLLIQQKSPEGIADAVRTLMRNPTAHQRMRDLTAKKGSDFLWPRIGAQMNSLTHALVRTARSGSLLPEASRSALIGATA